MPIPVAQHKIILTTDHWMKLCLMILTYVGCVFWSKLTFGTCQQCMKSLSIEYLYACRTNISKFICTVCCGPTSRHYFAVLLSNEVKVTRYLSIFLLLIACNEVKKNSSTFTCNEVLFWPFSVLLLRYSVDEAITLQVKDMVVNVCLWLAIGNPS